MPGNVAANAGNAEAALPALDDTAGSFEDLGIDHDFGLHAGSIRIPCVRPRGDDHESRRLVDLRRGDADAAGVGQGHEHVVDQGADRV